MTEVEVGAGEAMKQEHAELIRDAGTVAKYVGRATVRLCFFAVTVAAGGLLVHSSYNQQSVISSVDETGSAVNTYG